MRYPTVLLSIGLRLCLATSLILTSFAAAPGGDAEAREGNRTLKLYFGHTKERGEFTFKRNGRYDKSELARINRFLRDWRRNEPTNMDPKLLDLVWAIYTEAGSKDYIHVVSAYRSPATNKALRSRSRGVAEKSQHMRGKAMDWYVTDVPLAKLRAVAMKMQGGGVGYYPTSGSPFVHTDTGSVRAWPRMSRKQLLALFPNGETLHLPADGKPLPGYERAVARRKAGGETALAYLETGGEGSDRAGGNNGTVSGWLKRVFDGGADQAEDSATAEAPAPPPAAPPAAAAPAAAPVAVPPALPAEPAVTGDPQMLIAAAEEARDTRLPRARPQTAPDMMLASIAPDLPPETAVTPADTQALASLAFPPLPRSRPDSAALAESLAPAAAPESLAVDEADAIAALAARSDDPLLASGEPSALPIQLAAAPAAPEIVLPSTADSAALIDYAAAEGPDAIDAANALAAQDSAPAPRPRPVALAFAGAGLRPGEDSPAALAAAAPAASAPEPADLPDAPKGDRIQLAAATPAEPVAAPPAAQPAAQPVYREEEQLVEMIGAPAERTDDSFSGFALPQPAGAPGLFAVPANADAILAQSATPKLPTLRFQQAPRAEQTPPAEESFFSRLFASLSQ